MINSASTLHFVLAIMPKPLPVSPLAGPKCTGLLSTVSSSYEKTSEVSSDSGYKELANTPVSNASGFPDGFPWLVSGGGWEDVPVCSVICWEGVPAVSYTHLTLPTKRIV